jgi:site-specific recombinase XerC
MPVSLVQRAKKVDNQVAIFLEKNNSRISEREIARKIKNQFTKEILKTSSPDFRKKIKEGFSVAL